MKSRNFLIVFFISSTLLFVGVLPSSFSESEKVEQIIINIEPPHEEFKDVSNEKDENNNENSNNGGSGNAPASFVTGSEYALNGIPILINTPEGIKLNDKLIQQQELEELENLHGKEFWERIDTLTYDHYGLADALLTTSTENNFFQNGAKYSENKNSNLEYYILERGYDPSNLSNVPNNIFTPLKYDLARAVMQKLQDSNANNLNIDKLHELDLQVLSPNAFSMTEQDQNVMYHNDVENRAMTMLRDTLPIISGSSNSNSDISNSQNDGSIANQENKITSMSGSSSNSINEEKITPKTIPPKINEEIFQNTEHIKTIISKDNFEPNYDSKNENIIPFDEILFSLVMFAISSMIGFIMFKKLRIKSKQLVLAPTISTSSFNYVHETEKLIENANSLYKSKQIKNAYEQFSHAIRFYYSYHYDMKREVTTFELLKEIKINQKSDYKIIYDCLVLCGIIEFAKHDERKNDFKNCISAFSKVIGIKNEINISGAHYD